MPPNSAGGALHGVIVTFNREEELAFLFETIERSNVMFNSLTVIDNSPRPTRVPSHCGTAQVEHVTPLENLGPAGGIAEGMWRVLRTANPDDWVVIFDDDDPPRDPADIGRLAASARGLPALDRCVGAVGINGARFDERHGEIVRVADGDLTGEVPVDYLPGGAMPLYRVSAIRDVGTPRADLFFGFDDLEYGLRLRDRGWHLYALGDIWSRNREAYGRLGLSSSLRSRVPTVAGWRLYYSRRNLIAILLGRRRYRAAVRASAIGLVKPILNVAPDPTGAMIGLVLSARAVTDAWLNRMGRRIEPDHYN